MNALCIMCALRTCVRTSEREREGEKDRVREGEREEGGEQ